MCGIAGFVDLRQVSPAQELERLATEMSARLTRRGPDSRGAWVDPAVGVALAFRRLAIIDLTDEGNQPMVSRDGRYVISFNGEMYNYREIRRELEARGVRFRGSSDTEVLVEAIATFGVENALRRANAMLAFALWDRQDRRLHLAVDRFGEKPLYWACHGGCLLFASELSAFRAHPAFAGEIDRDALHSYVRFGCFPAPQSVFRGVSKVMPGTVLTFDLQGSRRPTVEPSATTYWSAIETAALMRESKAAISRSEAADRVEQALAASVRARMVADVPIGAFLSGGIDSSLIVAMMQQVSSAPVRTFTIGFEEGEFDEAASAKLVAKHLGTDHTELYVRSADARAVISTLPELYTEPFADSSQIPTFLVSQLAKRHVTVALTGDGGDELFAGYNRYVVLGSLWDRIGKVPRFARALIGALLEAIPERVLAAVARPVKSRLPGGAHRNTGTKLHKLGTVLGSATPVDAHARLVSRWPHPDRVVLGGSKPFVQPSPPDPGSAGAGDAVAVAMLWDTLNYLPNDILTKVDRAAMAVSLETRVPFLDPAVFETAWALPRDVLFDDRGGKAILRDVLSRHVPVDLFDRPKTGFGIPLGSWLREPLREWAEDILSPAALMAGGYFDPKVVGLAWADHTSGRRDLSESLWAILVFEQWRCAQR